jgi:hypothetical protein
VAGLASPSWPSADHTLAKKLSPSAGTPRTLPSWLAAMNSPMPAPASDAYATAWDTTTAAAVSPASRSQRNQARR